MHLEGKLDRLQIKCTRCNQKSILFCRLISDYFVLPTGVVALPAGGVVLAGEVVGVVGGFALDWS